MYENNIHKHTAQLFIKTNESWLCIWQHLLL